MSAAPPPVYQLFTDGSEGDAAVVAQARDLLHRYSPSSKVLAAWKISESLLTESKKQTCLTYALCPPVWIILPCLIPQFLNQMEIMKHKIYILTDDGLVIAQPDCKPPCQCCSTTGKDFEEVLFASMGDIIVNNRGAGCCAKCDFPHVTITLPGQMMTVGSGQHRRTVMRQIVVYHEDPERLGAAIRTARKTRTEAPKTVIVHQPSLSAAAPAPAVATSLSKRVLVALAGQGNFKVLNIQSAAGLTLPQLQREAAAKIEFKGAVARLEMDVQGACVEVSSPDDLQNNDKVFVVPA